MMGISKGIPIIFGFYMPQIYIYNLVKVHKKQGVVYV